MKFSGRVISSLLFFSLVSGNTVAMPDAPETLKKTDPLVHLFDFEKVAFQKTYASLPPDIRAFERLDFDARMEQQEYLRLKYGDQLFMDTLRHRLLKQDKSIDALIMAMGIVALGRPVATLDPNASIRDIAEECGLKRLSALIDAQKKRKPFWRDKDQFYRDALLAEMTALHETGSLFDVYELMNLKQTILSGRKKTSSDTVSNSYHEVILKRAQERLNQEQLLYVHRSSSEPMH